MGRVHGQRGLADPGHAVDRADDHGAGAGRVQQPVQVGGPAGEVRQVVREGARRRSGPVQRRVGPQHLPVGPDQVRAGVDAELVGQQRPGLPVEGQGVGLPAAAVERDHELPPQRLPQRGGGDQRRQLDGESGLVAGGQAQLDRRLHRGQPPVVQPGGRGPQRPAVDPGQGRAAPERERGGQPGQRPGRGQVGEPGQVEGVEVAGPEPVAGADGVDPAGQPGPQPGDRLVHLVGRGRRRFGVPERVGQLVQPGHGPAGQQQRRQRLAGPRSADRHGAPGVVGHLQRPEHPELHAATVGPAPTRSGRSIPNRHATDEQS